jgi:gamma-glutamyltranspeptidase/glutathione hydrolase
MRKAVTLLFLFSATAAYSALRDPVVARHGMVAATSGIAAQVGVDIMKKGGNAVDAAVATALAMAVTWPAAGNLGGGGFMLIRMADGTSEAIDYRERAPLAASRDMYGRLQSDRRAGDGGRTDARPQAPRQIEMERVSRAGAEAGGRRIHRQSVSRQCVS